MESESEHLRSRSKLGRKISRQSPAEQAEWACFTNPENSALSIDLLPHGTRSGPPSNSPGFLNLKKIRRRRQDIAQREAIKKGPPLWRALAGSKNLCSRCGGASSDLSLAGFYRSLHPLQNEQRKTGSNEIEHNRNSKHSRPADVGHSPARVERAS